MLASIRLVQVLETQGAHVLRVGAGVVGAVHHLVAVVLLEHRHIVADALDEQVLPVPVEARPLRQTQWLSHSGCDNVSRCRSVSIRIRSLSEAQHNW